MYIMKEKKIIHKYLTTNKKRWLIFSIKEKVDKFDWKMLKGKTVIPGRKGGVPYMTLEYVIKQKGLTPGKRFNTR